VWLHNPAESPRRSELLNPERFFESKLQEITQLEFDYQGNRMLPNELYTDVSDHVIWNSRDAHQDTWLWSNSATSGCGKTSACSRRPRPQSLAAARRDPARSGACRT